MVLRAETRTPSPTDRKILGHVALTLRVFPAESADSQFAAECEELGVASCGGTIDEALRNIAEATAQYLNAVEKNGEVERVFRKRHIVINLGPPRDSETKIVTARSNETIQMFVHTLLVTASASLTSSQ